MPKQTEARTHGSGAVHVGVDIGGTFTDVVVMPLDGGQVRLSKVPTVTDDPAKGIMVGLQAANVDLRDIDLLLHGTTVATNAILEGRGARVAVLTTRGFRDVLELGRRVREHLYGLRSHWRPLVERHLRREISGRIDGTGAQIEPIVPQEIKAVVGELLDQGVTSVAVTLLHSYANSEHEAEVGRLIREHAPQLSVSLSSEVLNEFREFERSTATVLNAFVHPVMDRYIGALERALEEGGAVGQLLVMQSNGGVADTGHVRQFPAKTALSGPAAGVVAAAAVGRNAGMTNLVTADMGGTSLDVAVIEDGEVPVTSRRELGYNLPLWLPMLDIQTIGAGGGSIAKVDAMKLLTVGPASAGSWPGPISYGRGGSIPTVTDANVALGRLDVNRLPRIDNPASVDEVREAISEKIGSVLGLSVDEAAQAIIRVVNQNMAAAIRRITIERGRDPRDYALLGFGGGAGLHVVELARELRMKQVLVPPHPGVLSALGCAIADVRHDFSAVVERLVGDLDEDGLRDLTTAHEIQGRRRLQNLGIAPADVAVVHEADMAFQGQTHQFRIPFDPAQDAKALEAEFRSRYRKRYGTELPGQPVRFVTLRTSVTGRRAAANATLAAAHTAQEEQQAEDTPMAQTRRVLIGGEWVDCPVIDRQQVNGGLTGPAVIEEFDTTILLDQSSTAVLDDAGNLIIDVEAR